MGVGSAVTVMPGATLDLSGSSSTTQSFGSLSSVSSGGGVGGGTVILGSAISTLSVGSNNASTTFDGVIQDATGSTAGLTKTGSGFLSMGGTNTYTGATNINAGGIILRGGSLASSSMTTVGNGTAITTFAGFGNVGNLTINSTSATAYGILAPGTPAIGSNTVATAGLLNTGNLLFNGAHAQLDFLLGSDALAGTTYSTIDVNGNLTLNGAMVDLSALSGFGPGTYQLLAYTGTETGTLNLETTLPNGYSAGEFSIVYGPGTVDLVVSGLALPEATAVVPEPRTWVLFLAALLFLAYRKRKSLLLP